MPPFFCCSPTPALALAKESHLVNEIMPNAKISVTKTKMYCQGNLSAPVCQTILGFKQFLLETNTENIFLLVDQD